MPYYHWKPYRQARVWYRVDNPVETKVSFAASILLQWVPMLHYAIWHRNVSNMPPAAMGEAGFLGTYGDFV